MVRATKVIDNLQEILDLKKRELEGSSDTRQNVVNNISQLGEGMVEPSRTKCRDHDKPEGCKFGDTCKFFHDKSKETFRIQKTGDCSFWLDGSCKYSDKMCRNVHNPAKKGLKIKPRRQEESFLVQNLAGAGQVFGGMSAVHGHVQPMAGQVQQCMQPHQQHAAHGSQVLIPGHGPGLVMQPGAGQLGSQIGFPIGQQVSQAGQPMPMWGNIVSMGGQAAYYNQGQGGQVAFMNQGQGGL